MIFVSRVHYPGNIIINNNIYKKIKTMTDRKDLNYITKIIRESEQLQRQL